MKKTLVFIFLAILLVQCANSQEYKSFQTEIILDVQGDAKIIHKINLDTTQVNSLTIPISSQELLDLNDGSPNVNYAIKDNELIINPKKSSNYQLIITYYASSITSKNHDWTFSYYQKTGEEVTIQVPYSSSVSSKPEYIKTIDEKKQIYKSEVENAGTIEIKYSLGKMSSPNTFVYLWIAGFIIVLLIISIIVIINIKPLPPDTKQFINEFNKLAFNNQTIMITILGNTKKNITRDKLLNKFADILLEIDKEIASKLMNLDIKEKKQYHLLVDVGQARSRANKYITDAKNQGIILYSDDQGETNVTITDNYLLSNLTKNKNKIIDKITQIWSNARQKKIDDEFYKINNNRTGQKVVNNKVGDIDDYA